MHNCSFERVDERYVEDIDTSKSQVTRRNNLLIASIPCHSNHSLHPMLACIALSLIWVISCPCTDQYPYFKYLQVSDSKELLQLLVLWSQASL